MKKKRKIILVFILLLIIIIILTKSYLFLRLLLGNDLILKLNLDKENIFTSSNKQEEINFKIYTATNLFCTTNCDYEFIDISNNKLIEKNLLKIKSTNSITKKYAITTSDIKTGQELYQFNINCKSVRTTLCQTKEELKTKTLLLTINYNLTEEEQAIKESSKGKILYFIQRLDYINSYLGEFNSTIERFNLNNELKNKILDLNETSYKLKELWENENYLDLEQELNLVEENFTSLENGFNSLNSNLYYNISSYNTLIENLTSIKLNLENLKEINITEKSYLEISSLIEKFNNMTSLNELELIEQENLVLKLIKELENLNIENNGNQINLSINYIKNKIDLHEINSSLKIELKEPLPKCCLFEKCGPCYNNQLNSPIIFVHGHDFNKDVSAENSLDVFSDMQKNLEQNNYINAGSILISNYDSNLKDILSGFNSRFTFKASYYFDLYKNTEQDILIQTKTDNIDTYAIRLKEIIDIVKFKTGKDKVTIISHSMGGLVVRRYIQVFGSSSLDKAILIGTPNKGIEEDTLNYCKLFGAELECNDMSKNSLFMNKISGQKFDIPVYNIIGDGCKIGSETGDGIVKKSDAYLENAENYIIYGNCGTLKFFHTELPKNDEVIKIINKILEK